MTSASEQQLRDFLAAHPSTDIADIGGVPGSLSWLEGRRCYSLPFDICENGLERDFPTITSMDTFEHILDPKQAAYNIAGSLVPGGWMFLTTVFSWPYHEHPIDTYRFSDTALRWLFRRLEIERAWMEEDGPGIRSTIIARRPS